MHAARARSLHRSRPRGRLPLPYRAVGLAILFVLSGCGGSEGRDGRAPSRPLPTYTGRFMELFDDRLEPAAVGLELERAYDPRADHILRERTQLGDAALRVRISTVTAKVDGSDVVYQLGLHGIERLAGTAAPPNDFVVLVTKRSDSYGIVKNFEGRLIGRSFIAFVREFAQPSGEPELHFHLLPDTKDRKLAVRDAMTVGELK